MSVEKLKARSRRAFLRARIRDHRVSMEARSLWFLIESYASHSGQNSFPSVVTLAKLARHNERWVEKYLRELVEKEWLQITKRPLRKGGFGNVYTLRNADNWGEAITPETWVLPCDQKGSIAGYQAP